MESSRKSVGCEECGEIMTSNSRLIQHMLSHRGVTIFCCEECEEVFLSETHLDQHFLGLHSNVKTYNCETCCRPFTSQQSLAQHRGVHQEPEVCRQEEEIDPKEEEVEEDDDGKYRCERCQGTFLYKGDLLRHQKTVRCHRFKNKCKLCNATFFRISSLAQHMSDHHVQATLAMKSDLDEEEHHRDQKRMRKQKMELCEPEETKTEEWKCHRCMGKFIWKGDLVKHLKVVQCWRFKHRCGMCTSLFFRQGQLAQHMKTEHGVDSDQTTNIPTDDGNHREVKYSELKDYTCDLCGKSFISLNSLVTHRSTHRDPETHREDQTPEISLQPQRRKIYKCKKCGGGFITRKYLAKHQKWAMCHKFRFRCSVCGAQFYRAAYRFQHMLAEHPYEYQETLKSKGSQDHTAQGGYTGASTHRCGICRRTFSSAQALSKHTVMHKAAKNYKREPFTNLLQSFHPPKKVHLKCNKCRRVFTLRKNLLMHQKLNRCHTYKHKCTICMASFFRIDYLSEHLMTQHGVHQGKIKRETQVN